jgi:hypothetical protein
LMREAGFSHLNLSLVTSNPAVRKETRRSQRMEKYLRVVSEASQLGFKIVSYQILGLPGEPLESMIRTLKLNCKLPVLLGASPFYLTPKTTIAQGFPEQTEEDMVRSRLTGLGLETNRVGRDAVYTLFVATRIINFFKGISLKEDSIGLEEALNTARNEGKRSAAGAELFERLMSEGRLYAATREGFKPLARFRSEVFFALWTKLNFITTQEGKLIRIK